MDIFDDLTLEAFAMAASLTTEQVLQAERDGEVFSCRIGEEPFGRYPAYQLLDEVRGTPLRALISAFGPSRAPSLYMFMRSVGTALGGASAVEVLCGQLMFGGKVADGVAEFLERGHFERYQAVVEAAKGWLAAYSPGETRRDQKV